MATEQVNKTYNQLSTKVNELNKTIYELAELVPELKILSETWQAVNQNLLQVADNNI